MNVTLCIPHVSKNIPQRFVMANTAILHPENTQSSLLYSRSVRVDDLFLQRLARSRLFRLQLRLKRLFDIVISGFLLVLLAPVILLASLAVRLTSPGPAIFWQWRWGKDQGQFRFFKLRSMYVDQSFRLKSEQHETDKRGGVLLKLKNDPRVTGIGKLLRRTSIDELPQLLNVLIGDMSMVGPRPLVLHMMEPFPEIRAVRSVVRPGLTGLWQISSRANNTSVMDMITYDAAYIATFSLWLDLKILAATPLELLRGTGAN
jgi:exopolysaccharide production protein ExoY